MINFFRHRNKWVRTTSKTRRTIFRYCMPVNCLVLCVLTSFLFQIEKTSFREKRASVICVGRAMTLDNFYRFFVRIIRMNCFRFSCSTCGYRIILSTIYCLTCPITRKDIEAPWGNARPNPDFS